jgi:hypothetical protein
MSGKDVKTSSATAVLDSIGAVLEGVELVRRRKGDLTHSAVKKFIDECQTFEGYRSFSQSHANGLLSEMKAGKFRPEHVHICTCVVDDTIYRLNGQHTTWARLQMPTDWPCEVEFFFYEAENMDAMRALYAVTDRGRPLSQTAQTHSQLAGTPEFMSVKSRSLREVPKGLAFFLWEDPNERKTHDGVDIAQLMRTEYLDLALKVCAFLGEQSNRDLNHLMRPPVTAAILATFGKAPNIAKDFWQAVADGTGFSSKVDPRLKIRNELMESAVDFGRGAQSEKPKVSAELMHRRCITAWNAYREGRPLKKIQVKRGQPRPVAK